MSKIRVLICATSLAAILGFLPLPTLAQLNGFNIKGDLGLKQLQAAFADVMR